MKRATQHPMKRIFDMARDLSLAGAITLGAAATLQAAADEEYEWDPTWGVHEEEWYDPSDWFNEDNEISYEEVGNYSYDNTYYGNDFWGSYDYWSDYGYDYENFQPYSTYYYQWSPEGGGDWVEIKSDKAESDKMSAAAKEKSKDKKKESIDEKDVLTMRGTIKSIGKAKAKGADKDHTFVVLETAKDKTVLVDFGPKAKLGKVNLEEGSKIQVRGPRTKLDGKYVLVAQQVSAADKTGKMGDTET